MNRSLLFGYRKAMGQSPFEILKISRQHKDIELNIIIKGNCGANRAIYEFFFLHIY